MASNNSGYYGVPYGYTGPEEGAVGGATGGDYQPPNPTDLNANLQVPHHAMQPVNSLQGSWYGANMYMTQIYPTPPSPETMYNGHSHYMPYSPGEGNAVPSINMPSMMAPQPSHTPSPSALTNGNDHHSPPTYYNPYVGPMTGAAAQSVGGCPPEDTNNHNLSNDSPNMAMQALTLNPVRVSGEENGMQPDGRSPVDWARRHHHPGEPQTGAVGATGGAEAVEIKQEAMDQSWRNSDLLPRNNSRSSSGASPLREEHEARENNWKAAGKTRTKDKYRVVYSDHQRLELEREFYLSRYITIRRKTELASQLCLSERQVKIWFQNRRAKERKQTKKREDKMDTHMSYHSGQAIHSISNHHHHHHHHQHLSHSLTGPPPAHIPLTPFMMDVKPNLSLD